MNFILRRRGLGKTSTDAIKALSKTGIEVVRNDGDIPEGDMVFRWGCTSNVKAKTIINPAKAIHTVANKRQFRLDLDHAGDLCPKTWGEICEEITFPCIVRPPVHHQGRELYFCSNLNELKQAWVKIGQDGYISEFIDKVAEYRVFIVSGRVVCVASKTPADKNTIAWNVAQGGKFKNVRWTSWPLKAVKTSLEGFNLSGLDFGGVDIMVDKNGKPYILEINSACSLTSPYRQGCFTKAFDYIVEYGKDRLDLSKWYTGYKRYIHPAIE